VKWYLAFCFLVSVGGVAVWEIGHARNADGVVVIGKCIMGLGVLALASSFLLMDHARCPDCKTRMRQGHRLSGSDGVFVCAQCGERWQTTVKWQTGE
jgi:hypothetical protein